MPRDPGVNAKRIGAAEEKGQPRFRQQLHAAAEKFIGTGIGLGHAARLSPGKTQAAPSARASAQTAVRRRRAVSICMAALRIAAVADVHYGKHSRGALLEVFEQISQQADVFLLCGDLTDYGLAEEAHELVADLRAAVRVPMIGVLGNHDFESGQAEQVRQVLEEGGVTMLDGEAVEIGGAGFAGVAGFGGGFGRRMLNAWGEPLMKAFVQEALDQALRLEQALGKLPNERRVAVLHYAPIRATVVGEDPEIFPFLGSSRLEEPINRFRVSAVVHGHAHNGAGEGATSTGIPVYNVSLPLLRKTGTSFRLIEI